MREREERLTNLFHRHADDIHAYATWRVGRENAPDVVSEVFLVAWRSLDRIRTGEERAWLFGVARKVVLSRRRQGAASVAFEEQLVTSSIVAESGPDRLAEDIALRDQVARVLNSLGERDREVLVAATWFDLTPAEAARALGVTRPTYLVRLHRARNRFRAAYQRMTSAEEENPSSIRSPLAV